MSMPDLQSIPVKSPDITFQAMPPETVLLNLETGYYYSTNELGSAVWSLCDGATTVEAIIRALNPRYDVAPEQLERDVLAFIRELAEEGLLLVQ